MPGLAILRNFVAPPPRWRPIPPPACQVIVEACGNLVRNLTEPGGDLVRNVTEAGGDLNSGKDCS